MARVFQSTSLADLVIAPQQDFLAVTPKGEELLEGTRLQAWLGPMNARPGMAATPRPEALSKAA